MGVPSSPRVAADSWTVSRFHGLPIRDCSVAYARIGVAAMPPSPIRTLSTRSPSRRIANATATLEMSSERRQRGQRKRDPDDLDQFTGAQLGLPVTGEVVGERDLPLTVARRQDQ